jgi:Pyruvate/2-oxoacid:ferredoxin oxidoreductase delta subunit
MKTTIYVYTGTGNSLWTARKLADHLDQSELVPLKQNSEESLPCDSDRIGLVFPVHIWGLPPPVIDFIHRLKAGPGQYFFAVAVNAGQVAATLIQLEDLLHARGLHLSCGFSMDLPSNYIPWGGAISKEKQQDKFAAAIEKCEHIATIVTNKEELLPEKGPLWLNPIFSMIYRKTLPNVARMDKSFFADEKCTACGICTKLCPSRNIAITDGKPVWQHRCEQCFACLQWCPEEAIQYGRNTKNKKRYHHPEVSLKDILASSST